jgi:hypothetical protein
MTGHAHHAGVTPPGHRHAFVDLNYQLQACRPVARELCASAETGSNTSELMNRMYVGDMYLEIDTTAITY